VVELIGDLTGLAERKISRQDDVLSAERDDEGALDGPGTYPRNCGELRHELVVWQAAQDCCGAAMALEGVGSGALAEADAARAR
jgi:hypothetical protein